MSLQHIFRVLKAYLYSFVNLRSFRKMGKGCRIYSPLKIQGKKNITIHSNVVIEYKSWLAALPITPGHSASLEIGKGSAIGHFNHIYATESIEIGENVLTADRVYISDNLHHYENVNIPIIHQPVRQIQTVKIGDGSWIGEGACIIGAHIGKGCVVGANAVVTKDVPDYCVVVGAPARIIKRYNHQSEVWERKN